MLCRWLVGLTQPPQQIPLPCLRARGKLALDFSIKNPAGLVAFF